jgi:hypothetical protein
MSKVGKDAPIAPFVCVGQCGASHGIAESHVIQLGPDRAQTSFDVTKALSIGQLGKGHGEVLLPAGELFDIAITAILRHAATELAIRKKTDQLGEDAFAFVHSPSWLVLSASRIKSRQGKTVSKGYI